MPLRLTGLSTRMAIPPLVALVLTTAMPAGATILTFDQTRAVSGGPVVPTFGGASVPDGYGDRVAWASVDVPGGVFTYGEAGEGFTPNVVADFFSGQRARRGRFHWPAPHDVRFRDTASRERVGHRDCVW